ncbi:G-box-binding factor 1-like isoform X3 [Salvia hispanica]|uniref:G-box-binding factor 1-like isoform X3 n=1 Tax=Salvia hispanica TaxID=49212 RepID=UPI002009A6CA|nr:G-box-binding factor 1-like isoform X3 [Salvia hispanica]
MGTGEESAPSKSSKPASAAQEAPATPNTPVYPDWSSNMQAFYGAGAAPPFFASTVASPTPHPYMWGGQHPMMPPYGTPVPYPALYPPGGIYAHPNMATPPGFVHGTAESDGKGTDGKDRSSSKITKGASANHGMISGKSGDGGKTASGSGNDGTHSAESGSEGSSDASDENNNQDFSASKKGSFDRMLADGANAQNHAGSGPMKSRPNSVGVAQAVAQSGMMNDQWIQQDERELKRQKRKQSNRESARRSRLRKQAECEELQHRVESLNSENRSLRDELQRLSEECEKLTSENNSIKDELTKMLGADAVSKLENGKSDTHGCSGDEEGNC